MEYMETINILIIDDNPGDRHLYQSYLKEDASTRYEFTECSHGEQAIEQYRLRQPDCVLLDYYLPDIEGVEVLEALVREFGVAPVIMLTSQGDTDIAVNLMKAGAQDYLS